MSRSRKGKGPAKPKARPLALDAESAALMRLVEAQRLPDVERAARRILVRRPQHHLALKALSFALIGQGRNEEALPLLEFAVARFAADPELHNNLGIVLSYLMRWDEALACFRRSLELHPGEPEVLKNLGVALSRMHRWNDAVPVLLQAIEHHPGDYLEAIQSLAIALFAGNRLDEASVCFKELWQDDQSEIRKRIAGAFDHFADLLPLSLLASVQRIREDELDILVDLQGWTAWHRAEVLALRCAPIQVNWLGYPGTLGHPRLADYLPGDATVTPLAHADCCTETLVHLSFLRRVPRPRRSIWPGCSLPIWRSTPFPTTRTPRGSIRCGPECRW